MSRDEVVKSMPIDARAAASMQALDLITLKRIKRACQEQAEFR